MAIRIVQTSKGYQLQSAVLSETTVVLRSLFSSGIGDLHREERQAPTNAHQIPLDLFNFSWSYKLMLRRR